MKLSIFHAHQSSEHWALVIDGTHGFDATALESEHSEEPLKPAEFAFKADKEYKLMNLNCEASFQSEAEMKEVFTELVRNIRMTGKPLETGSNCMDYVKKALEYLAPKHIPEVPPIFTQYFNTHYEAVKEKVYEGASSESESEVEGESKSGKSKGKGKQGSQRGKKGS